ncbi:MAG: hypothetical protein JXR07_18295 [Reichenbachiella sp.]
MTELDYILEQVGTETFFEKYFEKDFLHITGNAPDKFEKYLDEDVINDVITNQKLFATDTKMVKLGADMKVSDFTLENTTVIDPSKVLKHFADGASIALSSLHDKHAPLKLLCDDLTKEFGQPFQTNIYVTPGGESQGFTVHHDSHDVYVLQVSGSKKWFIYESVIELAVKDQGFDIEKHKHGEKTHEFIMNPGDVLYIPRGLMHAAQTMDEKSIHITTGALGPTWQDILHERINTLSLEHVEFRRGFKTKFWQNPDDPYYKETFDKIISILGDKKSMVEGLNLNRELALNRYRPSYKNPLKQAELSASIDLETNVQVYPNISFNLEMIDGKLKIGLFNKEVELDEMLEPIVNFMIERQKFQVKDLTDDMDDESKVAFVQTLVLEGMLEILV